MVAEQTVAHVLAAEEAAAATKRAVQEDQGLSE